jgi:hypothetical protein
MSSRKPSIIYLDMDGVLSDYESHVEIHAGASVPFENLTKGQRYKIADKENFFSTIPPMLDMKVLLEGIFKHDLPVCILSATGTRSPEKVLREKNEWLDRHLKGIPIKDRYFVSRSLEKAQYASPDAILIDDRLKAIDPFIAAGGIGILHSHASTTLIRLEAILARKLAVYG